MSKYIIRFILNNSNQKSLFILSILFTNYELSIRIKLNLNLKLFLHMNYRYFASSIVSGSFLPNVSGQNNTKMPAKIADPPNSINGSDAIWKALK